MVALARGQANTPDKLNWYLTVNGVLTDAYQMSYRILDITAGLPGTQVFPATPGTYEDVTGPPGRFATGSYYAYDNTGAVGWTPDLGEPLGTHRVEWRWKTYVASNWQAGCEDFEVLAESAGAGAETYCTLQCIRDLGITATMAPDDQVIAMLEVTQELIDRACRQWFVPKTLILAVDGNDSDALHFGIPIIEIDYLRLNGDSADLDPSYYRVYNSRSYPDDRRNPRIKLIGPSDYRDIYTAPLIQGRLRFRKGRQNQEVKGTFGFVEADGSTPKAIRRAHCKLTVEKLRNPIFYDPGAGPPPIPPAPPIVGPLMEEVTDDHKQKFSVAGGEVSERRPGLTGITEDPEILAILNLYRAPIGLATPAHWSYT